MKDNVSVQLADGELTTLSILIDDKIKEKQSSIKHFENKVATREECRAKELEVKILKDLNQEMEELITLKEKISKAIKEILGI